MLRTKKVRRCNQRSYEKKASLMSARTKRMKRFPGSPRRRPRSQKGLTTRRVFAHINFGNKPHSVIFLFQRDLIAWHGFCIGKDGCVTSYTTGKCPPRNKIEGRMPDASVQQSQEESSKSQNGTECIRRKRCPQDTVRCWWFWALGCQIFADRRNVAKDRPREVRELRV